MIRWTIIAVVVALLAACPGITRPLEKPTAKLRGVSNVSVGLRGLSAEESMNTSINEMLARTIITGVTTLLVLFALLFLGGESIAPFSIALIVGIIIGTYSSIYTASATALALNVNAQDLIEPIKDPSLIDDLP